MADATMETFDVLVIGSGPGGYIAAIRASQLGLKTACVEKGATLGGTCLNVGCIPSKALLESSEHYYETQHSWAKHGIVVENVKLDLTAMMKRKEGVVRQLTTGISGLFKKNKVTHLTGEASFQKSEGGVFRIQVKGKESAQVVSAKKVIIATGSVPSPLKGLDFDGKRIISSTEALSLLEVPKHMVVVGGGVIGLELGSVWARLGSKVTVLEFADRITPGLDHALGKELHKSLMKLGLDIKTSTECLGAKASAQSVELEIKDRASGATSKISADIVLVSTGRKPYTGNLGLENVGLKTDAKGMIEINDHFQTSVAGVYAIGDVVRGPMLAHKAEDEGVAVAEILVGQAGHVNYLTIPSVIYTWPEVASVGYTEEQLKEKGIAYKVGSVPFMANARAKAIDSTDGFAKVLADAKSDRVLGVHIIGPAAGDLIAEAVAVMEFGGSSEDIARTCHAHPTLAETLKEAALAVDKRTLNF